MHLGATPISGGPFASAQASTDLGRPPQTGRNRADLGSSPLESADSGGRAEIGSFIEIRADMGQNSIYILFYASIAITCGSRVDGVRARSAAAAHHLGLGQLGLTFSNAVRK